jgi:hypothetical protein
MHDTQPDAPRLLLAFLAAAALVVMAIILAAVTGSYWAVAAADARLVFLLVVFLGAIGHELREEE